MASKESVAQSHKASVDGDGVGEQYRLSRSANQAGEDALSLQEATTRVAPIEDTVKTHHLRRVIPLLVVATLIAAAFWTYSSSGGTLWAQLPWREEAGLLRASGTLEADEVLIASEVAGRILELVQEGQTVEADGIVARLDDSLIQVQIMQAKLAARQQLEVQAARYQLRSPISGVVTRVPLHVGEVVTPGQTVAAVADLTTLEFVAYVLERDLGSVRIGQEVLVSADPFPGRVFRGVVTSTNPRAEFTPRNIQTQADRLNLVFGVKIRVDNPDMALKPGMPADAAFVPMP